MSQYEYDLFLSCAHQDLEFAQRLRTRLQQGYWEGRPLKVFLYEGRRGERVDILPGEAFPIAIDKALKASRVFGYILSPASVQSKWVEKEYSIFTVLVGKDPHRYIVPLLRQDCEPLPSVEVLRHIDFRDDRQFEEGIESLLQAFCRPFGLRISGALEPQPERGESFNGTASPGQEVLEVLKDFARKGILQEFVEVWLREDDVRWETVCRDKVILDEQALAVFTVYNRQGENGVQRLRRKMRSYRK